jgi:molybdate transport system regulatory protein
MKISARNVLMGTIMKVTKGAVNGEVDLELAGGGSIAAIITNTSVDRLGLRTGAKAFAVIKASEVMIGKGLDGAKLSARNLLSATVVSVNDGAVNSEVVVRLPGGTEIVASITKASAHSLGLAAGEKVNAVVKASNVMIGVD